MGLLLRAVQNEFAADHFNIGVRFRVAFEPPSPGCQVVWRMKRVGGAVGADEALALLYRREKSGLALLRHGRVLVGARLREVAGGVKEKGVVFRNVFGRE